ncbi:MULTISPECIES: DUF2304 domain-containing protein [Cellulomonas]|uniref:DUF2304 domain-containing protein n=1 Tax=Cellulomonas iranensis TaxID=76862 RepID=A0ABU0GPJ3_9CELL|nr:MULTISPECIES: DUF2304 domain-containing protein [Cellulomonas]MDQ0426520.1 hypothetical protein [Cellulomonas iranensis]TFH74175.1 DUF2304 domain-containing protein [Cellulomonas sp. HD19AZ1]UCN15921.1 DUF2304 domain-containing protein [Cellulomonas iranensis]
MLIKLLLVVAIAAVFVLGLRPPSGARHLALRRVTVVLAALLATLSVIFPDTWNLIAEFVGVGRGTDLLLYGLIIAFLLYMVTTYRRFRDMEQQITSLARRIAVDEAVPRPAVAPVPLDEGARDADER